MNESVKAHINVAHRAALRAWSETEEFQQLQHHNRSTVDRSRLTLAELEAYDVWGRVLRDRAHATIEHQVAQLLQDTINRLALLEDSSDAGDTKYG